MARICRSILVLAAGAILCAAAAAAQGAGKQHTETRRVTVERISMTSARPFDEALARLESNVGHPDMNAFRQSLIAAQTEADLERVINQAVGLSGLIEFARYDLGEVLWKEGGSKTPRVTRLLVGNPLIMKQMVKHVQDAGSYAPITILVDERPDGVHISYDRMASYLAPYKNADALSVARDLDAKVEKLMELAAY
jgi:uncharacterized protein (DUF302 family)